MFFEGLTHRIINRNAVDRLAQFAGRHTGDNMRSVIHHVLGEGAGFPPGNSLDNDAYILIS